jgi:hypothetical protein
MAIGILLRTRSLQCSDSPGADQRASSCPSLRQFDIPVVFSLAKPNQFVKHSSGGELPVAQGPSLSLRTTPLSWIKGSLHCTPERMWHGTHHGHARPRQGPPEPSSAAGAWRERGPRHTVLAAMAVLASPCKGLGVRRAPWWRLPVDWERGRPMTCPPWPWSLPVAARRRCGRL